MKMVRVHVSLIRAQGFLALSSHTASAIESYIRDWYDGLVRVGIDAHNAQLASSRGSQLI